MSKEDLLKQLQKTPMSCKDVTFRFFGLYLATLNTVSVTTGGTGLTTINKGSVLYSDADDSIAAADGGSVITGAGNTGFLQYSVTGDAVAWTESIDGGTY